MARAGRKWFRGRDEPPACHGTGAAIPRPVAGGPGSSIPQAALWAVLWAAWPQRAVRTSCASVCSSTRGV